MSPCYRDPPASILPLTHALVPELARPRLVGHRGAASRAQSIKEKGTSVPTADRTRSLADIEHLLRAAGGVESAVTGLLERRAPIDVLEVGFGHGRALLELAWRLRDREVTFHGVDIGYKSPVQAREDLRGVARSHARNSGGASRIATIRRPHRSDFPSSTTKHRMLLHSYSKRGIGFELNTGTH